MACLIGYYWFFGSIVLNICCYLIITLKLNEELNLFAWLRQE
ncbi:hypothetical protein PROVALCAL_01566 [Providencia alcalifaciens DSM 30120]|uniref:Uncharacterized protein n=1 Tax=Providencia alcalifaciens DSM 30120 TaxID=520999 RepID=B6XDZ1_9GAMM|nr:hypothetical protein PROVALCAL_01566 [Providencia alcalifaciens DSM 30120]